MTTATTIADAEVPTTGSWYLTTKPLRQNAAVFVWYGMMHGMNKAFIFDMDGVLVDSERIYAAKEYDFMVSLFGKEITDRIGNTMGVSVNEVYKKAADYGTPTSKDEYVNKHDENGRSIYARAALVGGTDALVDFLIARGFKLGIVSATRLNGIEQVLRQLPFREKFEVVISINDAGLPSKPEPDGFLEALRRLDADPKQSIVLEDSNRGIASGKAAGCYVIGYRGLLAPGYEQTGADAYADTMHEVITLVEKFTQS